MWNIEYDQSGFTLNTDWLILAKKTEDILQLGHIYADGPILDVGFYEKSYKVYIIYNNDWDKPTEVFESQETELIAN